MARSAARVALVGCRFVALLATSAASLLAQHRDPTASSTGAPPRASRPDQNGVASRAMHAPLPTLPPLVAWQHIQLANAARADAQREHLPHPSLPPRPAGGGRYICAVITCADADTELAPLLGLARADVLVLRLPGPFVTAEAVALIERVVETERLSLLLVLAHDDCRSLAVAAGRPADALGKRVAVLRALARRTDRSPIEALLQSQRELLLATSNELRTRLSRDELRIMPGVLDVATGRIDWRHRRVDELPLAPVK